MMDPRTGELEELRGLGLQEALERAEEAKKVLLIGDPEDVRRISDDVKARRRASAKRARAARRKNRRR